MSCSAWLRSACPRSVADSLRWRQMSRGGTTSTCTVRGAGVGHQLDQLARGGLDVAEPRPCEWVPGCRASHDPPASAGQLGLHEVVLQHCHHRCPALPRTP